MSLGVYTHDELEAIRAAIAHVTPTSYVEDADHLLYVVECWAGGARYALAYSDDRSPSERAADLEAGSDKLLAAARTLETLDAMLQTLDKSGEAERERTIPNLVENARALKKYAVTVRDWKYRKGKQNKAHIFLHQLLGLWVAAGQEIGRYNKTSVFLEAAAAPIFPNHIKDNTIDSFIRSALKKPSVYAGTKPQEISDNGNLG